jgi:hypothetical protein
MFIDDQTDEKAKFKVVSHHALGFPIYFFSTLRVIHRLLLADCFNPG